MLRKDDLAEFAKSNPTLQSAIAQQMPLDLEPFDEAYKAAKWPLSFERMALKNESGLLAVDGDDICYNISVRATQWVVGLKP